MTVIFKITPGKTLKLNEMNEKFLCSFKGKIQKKNTIFVINNIFGNAPHNYTTSRKILKQLVKPFLRCKYAQK